MAAAAWDGSPEANAYGYPYTEKSYSYGRPDSTLMPALSATRDYSRSRLLSEPHRDLDFSLLSGRVRYDAAVDEEGLWVYSYVDGFGRELIHRRFAENVTAPSIPASISLSTSIFRAGGGAFQSEGGEQKKEKKKDGGGIPPPQPLTVFDWDTDSDTYTPPADTPPHLVTYIVTLSASGTASAVVNFEEDSNFVGQYIYDSTHPTNVYTGSFVAYEGVDYDVEAKAGADPDLGGSASADVVMTIKVDGKLRVVMDTRYDRDVVDNPVTVYPPNYFFPPHGSANDWRTLYTYDTRGRMLTRDTPDGGTAEFSYDYQGNLRFSQDAQQAIDDLVSFTTYDSQNRPLVSGQASYGSAFTSLDPIGGESFESTTGNWLTARFYGTSSSSKPSTGSAPWSTFSSEISSATISHGKGRLTAEATLSGNGADEKWQLTLYSYDADGRIVKKYIYTESASSVALAIDVTLDRQGMPTWQHTTVGTNNFYHWWDYDARGNLVRTFVNTSNSKPGTSDVQYFYNAPGLVYTVQYGGAYNSVPYDYNSRDWLTQIGDPSTTTYPFSAFYIYQNNGTIETTVYNNKQSPATYDHYKFDHTYDSMNRLLGADYSYENSGWQTSSAYDLTDLSYDPNGNLLAMKRYRSAGTLIDELTYEYTSGTNKLDYTDDAVSTTGETWDAEDGSTGDFAYDANGAMTALPAPYNITSAVYDVRGLVTKVVTGAGTTTYRYNSSGERYWRAGSDYYALDGAVQLGVFTTGGTLQYWNIIAGGRVVGRYESGNRKYYHTDHLGTTRAVVEGNCSSGCTIRESRDYDAWGVEMAGRTYLSGNAAKEGYTGKERDSETGLDYFGARFYLQAIGRWNAVDPMAEKYAGWSPYNYVMNNPMLFVDPDGRDIDLSDLNEKDRKAVENIIADLRNQTGLDLQYDEASGLLLNNGVISSENISNQLRDLISQAISSDIVVKVASGISNTASRKDPTMFELNSGIIDKNISNTDTNFDPKTFGYGMSFTHELIHTTIGQKFFNTSGRIYDEETNGVAPAYEFVNRFRRELDASRNIHSTLYGIRLNHGRTFARTMASKSRIRKWLSGNEYTLTRTFPKNK